MFFTPVLLIKKGELADAWLAATHFSLVTNVEAKKVWKLCQYIKTPVVPFAISTSGKLLYGVVK